MSRLMAVVAGSLVLVTVIVAVNRRMQRDDLPISGRVPDFHLIDDRGAPFSRANLEGRIWVADFIFTQCPNICPILSGQMQRLQSSLPPEQLSKVSLISFSVDPSNDTPQALRSYADRFAADPARWHFLTGERAALHRLISEGFQLAVAERSAEEASDGQGLITHSDRFVLVDPKLQIRGYYTGTDTASVEQLVRDIRRLSAAES